MFTALSCGRTSGSISADHAFYYYPEQNLYYDVSSSKYLYSLDGGRSWDSSVMNRGKEPVVYGKKITIASKSPEIWKFNAEHRKLYNGSLLNFNNDESGSQQVADATEKKIQSSKSRSAGSKEVKKPKKRSFLDKVFGKNKS